MGKECDKATYCQLVYLTSAQSMSSEMPGWMNHKLESRFLQEISTTSDMQMCCCLVSQLYLTLCDWSTPGYPAFTISWSLLKLMSMKLEMPSNHLTLCCPFSSCLQSFPASGSFPMSQFFASGAQSTRTSASASVLPMNIQD